MTTIQTIVTHDGPFHADDVFAVVIVPFECLIDKTANLFS